MDRAGANEDERAPTGCNSTRSRSCPARHGPRRLAVTTSCWRSATAGRGVRTTSPSGSSLLGPRLASRTSDCTTSGTPWPRRCLRPASLSSPNDSTPGLPPPSTSMHTQCQGETDAHSEEDEPRASSDAAEHHHGKEKRRNAHQCRGSASASACSAASRRPLCSAARRDPRPSEDLRPRRPGAGGAHCRLRARRAPEGVRRRHGSVTMLRSSAISTDHRVRRST